MAKMENSQEKIRVEIVTNNAVDSEVKKEKSVSKVEENAAIQTSGEPLKELLEKIKNQVEFYFGDVNMQRDKFLIGQTKLDDGWVPMAIMLNFQMLANMSKDADVILKAIESSELMEISKDKRKIRRSPKHPLPVYNKEYRKTQEARTAYVKGFPVQDTNIEKLKTFFSAFEPFESIIMRKYLDKERKMQFKGSIFIQFKTLENAKAFMARESIKYGDTELIKMWSNDYSLEKAKENEDRRKKKSEQKAKRKESSIQKDDDKSDEEDKRVKDISLPKGCVIHFTDVSNKCKREDIKECLSELDANIAFVDFKMGDKEGWVRLHEENTAKATFDKMKEGKILICKQKVTCRVLEGEEEEKYLMKAKEEIANTRQHFTKGKKNKKEHNSQKGQRKRHNSENSKSIPAKMAAFS